MDILHSKLLGLGLDDLRKWAGSKILNRGKSYQEQVYDLARTEDGGLLASVSGTDEYETWVGVNEDGALDYFCTCPYDWGACKHVVAVILVGLAMVKDGEVIKLAEEDDHRYQFMDAEFRDDEDYEDETYDDCGQIVDVETALKPILQKKKKAELFAMLVGYAQRFPEVKRAILETDQLQSGDIKKLVCSLTAEIAEVTGEEAWCNWRGEGSLPDYDHIHQQLLALLDKGHADEVVALGRQLWKQGSAQVGESHDEGETAEEVAECMEIIFEAVPLSSMSGSEQLLWFIKIFLEDDYSISDDGRGYIESEQYGKKEWQQVVEVLRDRLAATQKPKDRDDYIARYNREQIMNWLIRAFEESGQADLILPLLEKEVHTVQCYGRLVDLLRENGKIAEARQWCVKGYELTKNSATGIASRLQDKLREMADQEDNPQMVAAYLAQDFFGRPNLKNYLALQKGCEKVGCWADVYRAVMGFLEKGARPDLTGKKQGWPLPAPEVDAGKGSTLRQEFPLSAVLIDIAIYEKRLADVVALYTQQKNNNRWHSSQDQEVAGAVASSHPEIALAIWQQLAMNQIDLVKPSAYAVAATYLGKMRTVYQQINQLDQWQVLMTTIRTEHKRKIRLLEVLDGLEGKRLID